MHLAVPAWPPFIRTPQLQAARDPLRSLIYSAAERAVRDVYVDGNQVVADGEFVQTGFALSRRRSVGNNKAKTHIAAHKSASTPNNQTWPSKRP